MQHENIVVAEVAAQDMQECITVNPNEIDLLAWNVANEVLNGFAVAEFERSLGASREAFVQLAKRLRSIGSGHAVLNPDEASAFRNALALTLQELGEDEFETRTGHSFEEGKLVLARLNRSLRNRKTS